jgi:hypothetical protein
MSPSVNSHRYQARRTDRFEVMPNTSSTALTMALKKEVSVIENRAHHSESGKSPTQQGCCRKARAPARDPELEHMDGGDESRLSSTMSDPDRADLSISSEQFKEEGQEIIWVDE